MRAITRLDVPSVLKLFTIFYGLVGLFAALKGVIVGAESIQAPLGFAFPLCWFHLNVNFNMPQPASLVSFAMIFGVVVFYATTGLLSGAAVALVYNLIAPHLPLLLGQVTQEKPTAITGVTGIPSDGAVPNTDPTPEPRSPML